MGPQQPVIIEGECDVYQVRKHGVGSACVTWVRAEPPGGRILMRGPGWGRGTSSTESVKLLYVPWPNAE